MSYKVSYHIEEDFLIAEVKGVRQKQTETHYALNALKEISEETKKRGINKIITIWKIKGPMSPDQSLVLIANLKKYNWKKHYATASVHPFKENFESHQYTAKVAKTLNWNIRFFQDLNEAKNWISKIDFQESEAAE